MARKLAFIGFGEAGQYMSEGLIREAGADVAVVNASVSGETTGGGVVRLPGALERHAPDDRLSGVDLTGAGDDVTLALLDLARHAACPSPRRPACPAGDYE